jgi:hypothetical protein
LAALYERGSAGADPPRRTQVDQIVQRLEA